MSQLAKFLADHAMRQSEFAEMMGISQASVSRLAKGTSRPGLELAVAIEKRTCGAVPASSWVSSVDAAETQEGAA